MKRLCAFLLAVMLLLSSTAAFAEAQNASIQAVLESLFTDLGQGQDLTVSFEGNGTQSGAVFSPTSDAARIAIVSDGEDMAEIQFFSDSLYISLAGQGMILRYTTLMDTFKTIAGSFTSALSDGSVNLDGLQEIDADQLLSDLMSLSSYLFGLTDYLTDVVKMDTTDTEMRISISGSDFATAVVAYVDDLLATDEFMQTLDRIGASFGSSESLSSLFAQQWAESRDAASEQLATFALDFVMQMDGSFTGSLNIGEGDGAVSIAISGMTDISSSLNLTLNASNAAGNQLFAFELVSDGTLFSCDMTTPEMAISAELNPAGPEFRFVTESASSYVSFTFTPEVIEFVGNDTRLTATLASMTDTLIAYDVVVTSADGSAMNEKLLLTSEGNALILTASSSWCTFLATLSPAVPCWPERSKTAAGPA